MLDHRIHVSRSSQIPTEPHYAIIEDNSYYTPGDERSRTNPGHGYPASTTDFVGYIAFTKKEDLQEFLISYGKYKAYRVIFVQPVAVETKITVDIS